MDKMIGKAVQKIMGKGEKVAPVKKLSLKVKFQKVKGGKKKKSGKDLLGKAMKKLNK